RSIVVDYIKHRVAKEGFQWENDGRQSSVTPNVVQAAMRNLGDEFEERFRNRFNDLIEQLNITDNNAYDTFKIIVDETFSDGVNWGRIVALLGFAGCFVVYCFVHNKSHLADNVVEWVTLYIDTNLQEWLTSNDKWQGLVEFYSRRTESQRDWASFKTLIKWSVAGLGAITLVAFLAHKKIIKFNISVLS
ncbi:apoptosis regulator Bcl-2-like, partial [Physella acuta]|uniref:apoptosis regulator Bcl-2-like n=1 Tax=Physella acuta TaxID=109671 RepID=UPI0027DC18BA